MLKQSFLTAVFQKFGFDLDFIYCSEATTNKPETCVINCGKTH